MNVKSAKFYFLEKTIETEIIKDSYTSTEILHNNLQGADGTCSFKVPFLVELSNQIQAEIGGNKIKVEIKDTDGSNINTYYIKDSVTIEKTQKGQPISISAICPSFFLDEDLPRNIIMVGKTVGEIVVQILTEISFTDYSSVYIPNKISCFTASEGDSAKSILNELLYEYGYVMYFDADGLFKVRSLFDNLPEDKASITQVLDGSSLREKITINAKEKDADYVSATYSKLEYFKDTLIFSDTQNADDDNKCLIEIQPDYYLFESSDEKESSNRSTPKINYCDYDSTLGEVFYVSSITPDVIFDDGLDYAISRFDDDGNDLVSQASLWAYNDTEESLYVRKLDIYGNAYISTASETVVSSAGTKVKEIDLEYVYDKATAETFAVNLANYYRWCNFEITAKSYEDYEIGSYLKIEDYGIGTYYGRVIQKKRTLKNGCIEYKIETIADYTPAEIDKTIATVAKKRNSVRNGKDGSTYYTWIKYADTPTSGMSDEPEGKSYIGLAYNRVSQKESTDYNDYKWTLIKGENGKDGIDGTDGKDGADGTTLYTWIKYADTISGSGMSDDGTDKSYIGLAYNKTTSVESDDPSDYQWSLFRGKNGVDGSDGTSSISIEISNPTVAVPANSSGVATSYNRTPTEIHCYEGTKALKYSSSSTTSSGYWWVSISTSGLASGGKKLTASSDGYYATLGNSSAVTASTYSGRRTITVNGVDSNGTAFTRVAQQTITLVLAGEDANALQITPETINLCCGLDGTLIGDYYGDNAVVLEMKLVKDNTNQSFTYTLSNLPENLVLTDESEASNVKTLTFTADRGTLVPTTEVTVDATCNSLHYYKKIKIAVSDCGKYLGCLDSYPESADIGDYFIWNGSDADEEFTVGSMYYYDGSEWRFDTNDSHTVAGFTDAIAMAEELPDNSRYTAVFKKLTTAVLQVGKLFANQITLNSGGLIKSSNYNGTSTTDATQGFMISSDGTAVFKSGTFDNINSDGATITDGTFEGGLKCGNMTIDVKGDLIETTTLLNFGMSSYTYDSSSKTYSFTNVERMGHKPVYNFIVERLPTAVSYTAPTESLSPYPTTSSYSSILSLNPALYAGYGSWFGNAYVNPITSVTLNFNNDSFAKEYLLATGPETVTAETLTADYYYFSQFYNEHIMRGILIKLSSSGLFYWGALCYKGYSTSSASDYTFYGWTGVTRYNIAIYQKRGGLGHIEFTDLPTSDSSIVKNCLWVDSSGYLRLTGYNS